MNGSVTKCGKKSWHIKFELVPNPITGRRRYHMETIRGTKREAEMQLAKRINALAEGRYVAQLRRPSRPMRGTGSRILRQPRAHRSQWTAITSIVRTHIIPGLGSIELQKLDGTAIDKFYASRQRI